MASSNHEYTGYSKPIPKQTVPEIRSDPREIAPLISRFKSVIGI